MYGTRTQVPTALHRSPALVTHHTTHMQHPIPMMVGGWCAVPRATMPARTPQQCRHMGCPELAHPRDGYCAAHKTEQPTHRHNIKSHTTDARYNSGRWRAYSRWRLSRYPLCELCHERAATLTDHRANVNLGGEFWDEGNHQSACARCHNQKRAKERAALNKAQ